MGKRNVELWVGVFIFIGLFTLAYMTIRFGSYDKFAKSYDIKVSYKFTNGLVVGAPVRVAGVEAGRVKDLVLTPDAETKVDVIVSIDQAIQLRQNVIVMINSLGIMGEKYVEFLPQEPDAEIIQPGDRVIGVNPTSIAELTGKAGDFISSIQDVFQDEENGSKIGKIIANLVAITGDENQENISVTLTNFRGFSDKMNTFGGELETISKDKMFSETVTNFHEASASLNNVLNQIKSGEGTIGKLIYDSDLHDKIRAFFKDIMENPSKLFRPTKDKQKGTGSFLFLKKNE